MKAAVLESLNAPLVLRELSMPKPRVGQVHVRILAAGICGAQLQEIRGEKGNEKYLPHLLGHEGCGEIVEIGEAVTTVNVGDRVVLHWRKGEGWDGFGTAYGPHPPHECEMATQVEVYGAGPVHTFCTEAIISENRCTTVPSDTPTDLCCLLGCALSTALGVLENDAKLRMGESVLVVGCGGVGLSLISAAKMLGADVSGVDNAGVAAKGRLVEEAGGTFAESVWGLKKWFGKYGAPDCIIDTTGNEQAIAASMEWLSHGGRYILVGQPAPGESLRIHNARQLFDGTGATIIASQGGQFNPSRDLPRYVRLWRAGLLQAAGITHRLPLERINEGLDLMREGKAGRVIIEMSQ